MYRLHFTKRLGHIHMPDRHYFALHLGHLVHDPRFWLVLAAVAFLAFLIGVTIWGILYGESGMETPLSPYYRYGY